MVDFATMMMTLLALQASCRLTLSHLTCRTTTSIHIERSPVLQALLCDNTEFQFLGAGRGGTTRLGQKDQTVAVMIFSHG